METNQERNLTKPVIARAIGVVVPGTGFIVGGGIAQSVSLADLVAHAAELLREIYNRDVAVRFNSNGRSGGAYLKTSSSPDAVMGNADLGISVSEFSVAKVLESSSREHLVTLGGDLDGPDRFMAIRVHVQDFLLKDSSLANTGSGQFGKYAYVLQPSLELAVLWLKDHVDLDALEDKITDIKLVERTASRAR